MSELAEQLAEPSVPASVAELLPSAGVLLRRAREATGLHIAALAVSLKVPVKKLEALEADRFDLLLDAVFVRALACSVCRNLKIDPSEVLMRLPKASAPKSLNHSGINAPYRAAADGAGLPFWSRLSRPSVLAGLVFLLGALVLIFLPPAAVEKQTSGAGVSGDALKAPQSGDADLVKPSGAPALPSNLPPPGPTAFSKQLLPVSAVTGLAAGSAAPTSTISGIVVFTAVGESWVEVTDAKNVVVLRRTLISGDVVGVSGALPLSAVVGRADTVQVRVRGQAIDLVAIARDNVARFEVK